MHAVLEEVENNIACLVPDSKQDPIYVSVKALPSTYEIGDVFKVDTHNGKVILLEKDIAEKERRLSNNRSKRERLLKRSMEKKREDRNP